MPRECEQEQVALLAQRRHLIELRAHGRMRGALAKEHRRRDEAPLARDNREGAGVGLGVNTDAQRPPGGGPACAAQLFQRGGPLPAPFWRTW